LELIAYIILLSISVITILSESQSLYKWIFIPSVLVFMFIVRNEGFDSDINHYAIQMSATGMDLYYLREFVFWFGSRVLYFFLQDNLYTFLLMDLIWIIAILKVGNRMAFFDKKNLNNALLLVLMTSFPFVFGYENIYRQFYATIFALLSYSLVDKKYYTSLFILIVAFFMHNIVALLMPLFMMKKFYKFNFTDRIQIASIITLVFVSSLGFFEDLKSTEKTGLNLGVFYLLIFITLLVIAMLIHRKNIYIFFEKIPSLFFIVVLMLGLVTLKADMIAERLGMMFIVFVTYDLYQYSAEIKSKTIRSLVRLLLLLLFSLPTLLFESSKQFLM
jgi:hypothetical protein